MNQNNLQNGFMNVDSNDIRQCSRLKVQKYLSVTNSVKVLDVNKVLSYLVVFIRSLSVNL